MSAICWMSFSGQPWKPGLVDIDKSKYLTPTPGLRHTRASHNLQYTRLSYSDAHKNSFFLRTILLWNGFHWSMLRPLRSLKY